MVGGDAEVSVVEVANVVVVVAIFEVAVGVVGFAVWTVEVAQMLAVLWWAVETPQRGKGHQSTTINYYTYYSYDLVKF